MSDGLLRWGYLPRPRRTKAAPRKRRTAHRPVPSLGKSGTHCENRAFRGSQTAPPTFCNPGQRDPWQAGFVWTNPMLAETKTRRCIRPGRPEDLMQTRNRLRICSCPAHALPVLLIPPPGGPTACPEGGSRPPDPGGIKAAPQEAQDRPGTAPQLREDLGPIGGNTATRGQQTAPQQLPALPCI